MQKEHCKAYAWFQEPETLRILNFLSVGEGKVTYKGIGDEQSRKQKDFAFQSISLLTEKLRYAHNPIIQQSVNELLQGKSTTVLIMGNDQSKKQKILIGQSQNQGFLLQFLATLFETCYRRELQDRVTIKLSCWQHRDGKISDLLGGTGHKSKLWNWTTPDIIEGTVLVGVPEIIIRNMKTALKVIRIFMKSLELNRQAGDQTQNLTFTVKLQIDKSFDKNGYPTEYLISKLHIVKLSMPYYLRSPAKHAPWLITLFNYMQAHTLQKSIKTDETVVEDEFSSYLKDTIIKTVATVHLFTIFSNKMSANDCLTALKFSSYLQHLKLNFKQSLLNVPKLLLQRTSLESEIVRQYLQERHWTKSACKWLPSEQISDGLELQLIGSSHFHLMQAHNMLQYEYANLLTVGCDRLQKYIYTEQIQDYFYAKKVVLEPSPELVAALGRYFQMKKSLQEQQIRYIKKVTNNILRIKNDTSQSREWKYLHNSKLKAKQNLEKLFQVYQTLSTHFLFEKGEDPFKAMSPVSTIVDQRPLQQLSATVQQIISKIQEKGAEKSKEQAKQQTTTQPLQKQSKKKRVILDETEMMFTNPNVGLRNRKRS